MATPAWVQHVGTRSVVTLTDGWCLRETGGKITNRYPPQLNTPGLNKYFLTHH